MIPNPYEEFCDEQIELPVIFTEETGEEVADSVIYTCENRANHRGLHYSFHKDFTDDDKGAGVIWPMDESLEFPDELA